MRGGAGRGGAGRGGPGSLTPREQQLLAGLCAGLSFDQVATALGLSTLTVRGYSRGLYGKLQVRSRAEAVRRAWQLGLVDRATGPAASLGG
jgi:LuxR family transcriptional regulator, maltose regulon positive regulatory protein